MATVLDTAILLGKESTYGTPATLTDAFEGKADTFTFQREMIDSVGFRGGAHTLRSDRRVDISMGGEGALEIDVLSTGFGFVMQSMLSTVSGPTQIGATTAYTTTVETASDANADSYTVQIQRVNTAGTSQAFTHHGGVITGWSLNQEVGGLLAVTLNFDFEDVDTSTAAGTPAYAADNFPFDWTMACATINGVSTDLRTMSLNADLGYNTDRRFLRCDALKKQPVRTTVPSYEGELTLDWESNTEYDMFVSGAIVPIVLTFDSGVDIDSGNNYKVEVTMPACQFSGNEPVSSLGDVPSLALPFKVLDNGTDAAMTITYTSTDTAL
jgi:hypothetical protein